jgi:hypothetical protein
MIGLSRKTKFKPMSDLTSNSAAKSQSEHLSENSSIVNAADLDLPGELAVEARSGDGAVKKDSPFYTWIARTWWIPTSYLVPYLITLLVNPVVSRNDNLLRSGKVGAIGLGAAMLIAFVWFLDSNFGARQLFAASRDKVAKALVFALMLALWISWLCVGITMVMTFDQVNSPNSAVPDTRQP